MTTPAVAQKRRDAALAAFRRKNDVLQEVVKRKRQDTLPKRLSDEAYCHWESADEKVQRFSTYTFYSSKNETERKAAEKGLKALEAMRRAAKAKKVSKAITVEDVRKQLRAEEVRSNSFANQYNEQVKLNEALAKHIQRLEQDLSRANKDLAQVKPLRAVSPSGRKPGAPSRGVAD